MRETRDFKLHLFAQLFVQGAQGFVHKNQFRFKHQCTRQCDPLLLSTRKLCRTTATEIPHFNHIKRALHFGFTFRFSHVPHFQRERQVFRNGHVRKQGIVLKHHANPTFVGRNIVDRHAIQQNFAVRGSFKTSQHHKTRGLARA